MASISKHKLAHSVIQEIIKMIQKGDLKEGDKLPNQHEFASQLGVSRTVLREALLTLTQLGVTEQRPKVGTVIKDLAPALYSDQLTPTQLSDSQAFSELIEARRFIEVGAIELAVEHATDEQIQEMGKLVDEMDQTVAKRAIDQYTEKNVAFHFMIAKASNNRFMVPLLATVRGYMEQWMHESVSLIPGLLEKSMESHRSIYEAIKERDPAAAVERMKEHIMDLQQASILDYDRTRAKMRKSAKDRARTAAHGRS